MYVCARVKYMTCVFICVLNYVCVRMQGGPVYRCLCEVCECVCVCVYEKGVCTFEGCVHVLVLLISCFEFSPKYVWSEHSSNKFEVTPEGPLHRTNNQNNIASNSHPKPFLPAGNIASYLSDIVEKPYKGWELAIVVYHKL